MARACICTILYDFPGLGIGGDDSDPGTSTWILALSLVALAALALASFGCYLERIVPYKGHALLTWRDHSVLKNRGASDGPIEAFVTSLKKVPCRTFSCRELGWHQEIAEQGGALGTGRSGRELVRCLPDCLNV